ncbi:cysteine hydrolase family protein [Pararhodobacter zhoushanensis]|uniref:Cysteine hydrolase n=1 Tax=Pararhodobacter zhoushanensis TaxID=2479545 RepID=A0ABT3GYQ4_9RHOB|nr:cysteine hydrolase family protein [Pararhodobacter zhoushanensis]MCW1932658.1 cysteine hydrolase [Pararhodobacter zhoushanensis]
MPETALLIVDMQRDYFPGGRMALEGTDAAATQAAKLVAHFRAQGWPVLHVQHIMARSPAPFFEAGTEGAEIHPSLAPQDGETLIVKAFPNSFRETGLKAALDALGIERLVIAGAMSHMCIDATTRAAGDLGYTCLVADDACATRALSHGGVTVPAAQVHATMMAGLTSYATVEPTDAVLDRLG